MRIRKDNKELLENEIMLIADVSDALAHPLRVKMLKYIMTQNRSMKPVCTKDRTGYDLPAHEEAGTGRPGGIQA